MPTGYTAKIEEDGYTFEEYAMSCARAFGACVTMRDDPYDKEIPVFEPSTYHADKLVELEKELLLLKAMTTVVAGIKAEEEWEKAEEFRKGQLAKNRVLLQKYEDMLVKVKGWVPPTSEHINMKDFMIKQIEDSIKWDCNDEYYLEETPKKSGAQWLEEEIQSVMGDIEYHTKNNKEEIERVNDRNQWISDLKESLNI